MLIKRDFWGYLAKTKESKEGKTGNRFKNFSL